MSSSNKQRRLRDESQKERELANSNLPNQGNQPSGDLPIQAERLLSLLSGEEVRMTTRSAEITAELNRIAAAHGGFLKPADVVEAARPPRSILHNEFDWDDRSAAQEWRLEQAKRLIRISVSFVETDEPRTIRIRAFTSLSSDRLSQRGYRRTITVLSDDKLRSVMLADALEELEAFRKRYARVKELVEVFAAIRKVKAKKRK